MLQLYNTLTRKKEIFKPLRGKNVGLYTCGPTVYLFAHIGNLRTYVFEDILKRVLKFDGFKVKHVMNITDVGHLTSNADTGEDKVEKEAAKEHKTAWEIAEFYTKAFMRDAEALNIVKPDIVCKATDNIKEQIALIKTLEKKGFAYKTQDGIYFDTSKLKDYGKLTGMKFSDLSENLKAGARVEMVEGKKNITDFALWKFSPKDKKRQMEWKSPWSTGFPGWHIECSAMAMKYLGKSFDIHCGGVDHIAVHHTNEIVQSEAATGKPFVKYWMHGAFLVIGEKEKMAKSLGNIITVSSLIENGVDPIAYRYLILTAHYRSSLNFTMDALKGAEETLYRLYDFMDRVSDVKKIGKASVKALLSKAEKEFSEKIDDDLNMPEALVAVHAFVHDVNKLVDESKLTKSDAVAVKKLMLKFDDALGLNLGKKKEAVPAIIKELVKEREEARARKDFAAADSIRNKIRELGWIVEDTQQGPRAKKA